MKKRILYRVKRTNLKIRIVAADLRYQDLAAEANRHLPEPLRLSEQDIAKLVTCRKNPTFEQAQAIAKVLRQPLERLFGEEILC